MSAKRVKQEQVLLNLVVNQESNKVLFAEAGKDFVDVLCSFLTFPLGTIARLLGESTNICCLNSICQSVANLKDKYLQTSKCKEMLLRPRNSSKDCCAPMKLNIDDTEPTHYFICRNLCEWGDHYFHCYGLSTSGHERCPCRKIMDRQVSLECDGFVQRGLTFIITDDLAVKLHSLETTFSLIQSFGIINTSSVKQMTVNVTKEKVLDLLKYSLFSNSALTDLFLETKPLRQPASFFSHWRVLNYYNTYSSVQIEVKLFVRKSDGKILFAQGDRDFADFIFSFLTFPLGGVVRMLGGNSSLGCIDGLYKSLNDLNGSKYFMSDDIKDRLVDPSVASHFKLSKQILPIKEQPFPEYYCYYQQGDFRESIIRNKFSISNINRACGSTECCQILKLCDSGPSAVSSHGGSYVKGKAVFMATDDLVVTSTTSSLVLFLHHLWESPPTDLKEKVVTIGVREGCSILKAALTSKSALTNGLSHLITEV